MNEPTKKLLNEMRRKELQWNSEKAIFHQKIDQLQTKCKSLQERLDSQHKACRILIDSIRQINENDSVAQLNKIECQLDEIKNFNSSQRQVIKKYIQDLMVLVQRQNSINIGENKTKILTVKNFQSQSIDSQVQNQENKEIKENDITLFQMICWNCQKIFDSKNEIQKAQNFLDKKNQFKKKNEIERINLDDNQQKGNIEISNLSSNLSPTKQKQKSYSIHSIDEESQNSNDVYEIFEETQNLQNIEQQQIEDNQQNNFQSKQDNNIYIFDDKKQKHFLESSSKKESQIDQSEIQQQNFQHKRVNSDSVFLTKPAQQNKQQEQDISTPQFDLQKQTNIKDNMQFKSNRNLMDQFVSEMYNSNNQQEFQKEQNTQQQFLTEQTIQEESELNHNLQSSNIASLKKNNKTQNNKVISFSNIDQIQQVIENEIKKDHTQISIDEIVEQEKEEINIQEQQDQQEETKEENQQDLKQSEYPLFNIKNFQQELFGKKESLASSAQLKTLLSQTSRNYSNAKQQKKFDRQITREFEKESFVETKKNSNLQRLSHSSEFEQNKLSQNLFKQGSNITRHKVNKKFEFQHKKSEGNVPNFNDQQKVLKRLETEDIDYFDVKLDYEIIQRNLNLFQSPEKQQNTNTKESQTSLILQNKNKLNTQSPQKNEIQKNLKIDYLKRKSSQTEKRENNKKFQNMILGKSFQRTSREKQKKVNSQEKKLQKQPYIQYKSSFQIPKFISKKSFKENQKIMTLQKSNFDKLIPQRLQQSKYDSKLSPKYKSFYKKNKTKKNQGSFKKRQNKKDDKFNVEIINTELIKIPTTIKRVTLRRVNSRNTSPIKQKNKKNPKDSLKDLQSALNDKFYEINSKIFQLKFIHQQ